MPTNEEICDEFYHALNSSNFTVISYIRKDYLIWNGSKKERQ
jgi:hypothetical protein